MRVGSKKIFHLEAWVVKVMALYKVRLRSAAETPDSSRLLSALLDGL
jgi:hypothetical protein